MKAIPYEGPSDLGEILGDLETAVGDVAEGAGDVVGDVGSAVGSMVPGGTDDEGGEGGAPLSGYGALDDDISHGGYNPMPDKTAGERMGYGSTEDC